MLLRIRCFSCSARAAAGSRRAGARRAGADDRDGDRGLVRRRQDGRQPPGRQEHDRRLLPAALRCAHPCQGRVEVRQSPGRVSSDSRSPSANAACVRAAGALRKPAGTARLLRMPAPAARLPGAPSATRRPGGRHNCRPPGRGAGRAAVLNSGSVVGQPCPARGPVAHALCFWGSLFHRVVVV